MTKFEACITRLEALCTLGARVVEVYGGLWGFSISDFSSSEIVENKRRTF